VNFARIGYQGRQPRLENSSDFIRFYPASIERQPPDFSGKPIGYVIHAHCWALLNQPLGITFNQTKLQGFIRAARKYWRNNISWGRSFEATNLRRSPLIIPEIQNAIERVNNTKSNGTSFEFTKLPLELRIMIVELVCPLEYEESDLQCTRNMLSAFGWILPESFWRSRFPLNDRLIFELSSYRGTGLASWQSICLELVSLLRDREKFVSSGLQNRERVIGIIDGILGVMEKSSCRTARR